MPVGNRIVDIRTVRPVKRRWPNAEVPANGRNVRLRRDAGRLLALGGELARRVGQTGVADMRTQPCKLLPVVVVKNPHKMFRKHLMKAVWKS